MFRHAMVVICGIIVFSAGLRGQVTTGSILGTVSDSTGGVIPGVVISIRNVDTGISRAVVTGETGQYSVPQLPLGAYEATADHPGFQSVVRSGITLTVGREALVDFVLPVGTAGEVVNVNGEVPLIETTSSSVSGLVNQTQMRELPLNARSYEQFAFLQPNVYQQRSETSVTNTGFAPKISAGGMRTAYNQFLEDGIDIADTTGQTPGSAAGQLMGVETLQEFRVLTSNYAAQYGNALGAVVEVASRGGTNTFHGSLFEFLRNDILDARSFFDTAKNPYRRNQFGGTIGGPIIKDRLFFFSSYEAMRQRLTTTETVFVPTAEAHLGILPDPADPAKTITIPLSMDVKRYLDMYPVAQVDLGSGIGTYRFPFKGTTRADFVSGRVDYRYSNNVSYFGRYRVDDTDLLHRKCALCIDPWAERLTSRNQSSVLASLTIFDSASCAIRRRLGWR
jgi:Carboxypeptidase regulatory-like domain/TonB-dependent Receptor Plug Domain